jgi:hypothetical protein
MDLAGSFRRQRLQKPLNFLGQLPINDHLGSTTRAEGFRQLGLKDDHEILKSEFIVYDALYAYCQTQVGK